MVDIGSEVDGFGEQMDVVCCQMYVEVYVYTGWWFQTSFIFTPI